MFCVLLSGNCSEVLCDDGVFCGDEYKGLGESKGNNDECVHRLSIHENMFMPQTHLLTSKFTLFGSCTCLIVD